MGQYGCLHRGRPRPTRLQLDGAGSDLRHLPRPRSATVCADWFHAASAFHPTRAIPTRVEARIEIRQYFHWMGLSSEKLRKMGGAGLPMGEALRGEIRRSGSGAVVLGSLE